MSEILTVNGVTVNRVTADVSLSRLTPYARGGHPSFSFSRRGITLAALPDAYAAKPVTYTLNGTLRFSGDCTGYLDHNDPRLGWVREYTCAGLSRRAEYIPVTDPVSLTDTIRFNVQSDDPNVIPSRQGRSVGQIVADVLEMSTTRASLIAAGIGAYVSAGTGAAATSALTGRTVSATFAVTAGGTGYTTAPTVLLSGGGGSGATAFATVAAGAVTAITRTAAGSGYSSPPVVILSTLPAATLTDLDQLYVIPPYDVTVAGERVLGALEGVAQGVHPNHWIHVEPTGVIRFLDPRAYAPSTLTLGPADRVGMPQLNRDWGDTYTRVLIRGNTLTQGVTEGLKPAVGSGLADNGLAEDFAHDGLTNAQAKAQWAPTDFSTPGLTPGTATATAVLSGRAVASLTLNSAGFGYTSAPPVTISGSSGSGATATSSISGGKVTGFTVTAGGSGYAGVPSVTVGPPGGVGQYDQGTCTLGSTTSVTVTSSTATAAWIADYWDQTTSGRQGVCVLTSDTLPGFQQRWAARVIACTALTAGGTCVLTLDDAAPSTAFGSYQLYGRAGGAASVGRRYRVTNAYHAAHMQQHAPYPMPYRNPEGTAATSTTEATATVYKSADGSGNAPYVAVPVSCTVDPDAGVIFLNRPAQMVFSTDGKTPVWPDDVIAFLPVLIGTLTAAYPPDVAGVPQFAGTGSTVEGLQRTKFVTAPDWRDKSNAANMLLWATELHGALSDTVVEGSILYHGLLESVLAPGVSLNVDAVYTTGFEALGLPVVSVDLDFCEDGPGVSFETTVHLSNRRAPFSGAAFARPGASGAMPMSDFGGVTGGAAVGTLANVNDAPTGTAQASIGNVGQIANATTDGVAGSGPMTLAKPAGAY